MIAKSMLMFLTFIISLPLHCTNFFTSTNKLVTFNQCPVKETENILDISLINNGYFIVSDNKKENKLFFTRFGAFKLNDKNYIVSNGDYLLGLTKNSNHNKLNKIKISTRRLAPRATNMMRMGINLPARAVTDTVYKTSGTIYDSLGEAHEIIFKFIKIPEIGVWNVQILIDNVFIEKGTLMFGVTGKLTKQEGLKHIQWNVHELKIDLKESTQYAEPFLIDFMQGNGYPMGVLVGLNISLDGEVSLRYNNGQSKTLKNRIAVALFPHPEYLDRIIDHLHSPNEQSGQAMIHWRNSDYAILSHTLEDESCVDNKNG